MFGKKQSKKPVAKPEFEETREDDLGPYPADVDSNPTKQRVLERALRMTTVGLGVSATANVALVALIIALLPLKQVYPYLVTFKESDEKVVAIEPLTADAPGIQFATEANVRQYVKLRHTFSPIESFINTQWGPDSQLAAMSDAGEYSKFAEAAVQEKTQMMTRGLSRSIDIESATMVRPDTWQVAFTTTETPGGNEGTLTASPATGAAQRPSVTGGFGTGDGVGGVPMINVNPPKVTKRWLATMNIAYQPQRITFDKRLLNPLGFTVVDYSVIERN